ncbi:MAG: YidC/Oxa1 family membrane protein insertase, partial [Puniceicoccales bacterium]
AGISKLLLYLMIWIHGIVAYVAPTWGWGFTIIIVTIIIKTLLFPLTQIQVRSAKRMSKIQPMMQELREKYKDNPQEMQKQTLELFRKHKVNPAAGCLPLILQIPIFFALFYMLRTVSELRFAPFLWIPDLSVSDTMAVVMGFPINPLPLIMAVTMFVQMQMMPTPTTDNMQRTIFKFMPLVFLFFCYNFPAGLVLYWTCQNLFTIGQQWLTNRHKDSPEEEALTAIGPDGKGGPKKPSFSDRVKSARDEQLAAKRSLKGKGLPQQKKKRR